MTIKEIHIENFKGIDKEDLVLKGKSIIVSGRNESNKTSVIQAIFEGLSAKGLPPKPIKDGEDEAVIDIHFGDDEDTYRVVRKFKGNKATLSLTRNHEKLNSPQTKINDLVGSISFDPFKFSEKRGSDQIKIIKKFLDIDTSDIDNEIKEVYDDRKYFNREIKEIRGSILESDYFVNNSGKFDDSDAFYKHIYDMEIVEIDSTKVLGNIERANEHNSKIDDAVRKIDRLYEDNSSIDSDIAGWKKDIELLLAKIDDAKKNMVKNNRTISTLEKLSDVKRIDVEPMKKELENMDMLRKANEDKRYIKKQVEKFEESKAKKVDLDNKLDELRAKLQKMISDKGLPSDFAFEGDVLTYKGLPFTSEQINTASIIKAGLDLIKALGLSNDLKIVRFDGSLLDTKNRNSVIRDLEEDGYQVFVELVDDADLKINYVENIK